MKKAILSNIDKAQKKVLKESKKGPIAEIFVANESQTQAREIARLRLELEKETTHRAWLESLLYEGYSMKYFNQTACRPGFLEECKKARKR